MGMNELNDYFADVSKGVYANKSVVYKFGTNSNVGTVEVPIWDGSIAYTYLTTATIINVVSSAIADTILGAGARTVRVFGLNANWEEISEIVELNGTTIVPTVNEYLRVYRAQVVTSGGNGLIDGANDGNITFSSGANLQAQISIGNGQTLMSIFTVPLGYKAIIWQASATTGKGKDVVARIRVRDNSIANSPFVVKAERDLFENSFIQKYKLPAIYGEKSDIMFTCQSSAASTKVSASFQLMLERI